MYLKEGDKVICVNNQNCNITLNKIYTIYNIWSDDDFSLWILINNDNPKIHGDTDWYEYKPYFKRLIDIRKEKIKQINESNMQSRLGSI